MPTLWERRGWVRSPCLSFCTEGTRYRGGCLTCGTSLEEAVGADGTQHLQRLASPSLQMMLDPCLRSLPTADDGVYSFTSTAFQPCCSGAFRAPRTWISPSQAGHPHAHSYRLQFLSPTVLLPFFSNWGETRAHQKQEWLCLVTFLWSRYH